LSKSDEKARVGAGSLAAGESLVAMLETAGMEAVLSSLVLGVEEPVK